MDGIILLPLIILGVSKILNVANQAIPLYKQAKPMVNNAKNIFSTLKSLSNLTNCFVFGASKSKSSKTIKSPLLTFRLNQRARIV